MGRSLAWYAKHRCYKYSKEDIKTIQALHRVGFTINEAIKFFIDYQKKFNPQWIMELNDTKKYNGPEINV